MVLAFAHAGADVVVASRKLPSCEATADEVRRLTGRRALPVACHVGDWKQVEALAAAAYRELGRIDVLVNNAGMSPLYDRVDGVSEELYDKVLDVNLKGPFRLTALVGARMAAGDGGSIIFVSSTSAVRPTPETIPYSAAKAGINAMTVGFARAFGPKVRVNCIQPGPFLTDIPKLGISRSSASAPARRSPSAEVVSRRRSWSGALFRFERVDLHDGVRPRDRRRRALTREAAPGDVPPEVAPVRAGESLDWSALEAWVRPRLADALPAADGPLTVLQFPKGPPT